MDETRYLYILFDPTYVSQTFYIGYSKRPRARLTAHINRDDSNQHKINWINKLEKRKILPNAYVVSSFPNEDLAGQAEVEMIAFCRKIGIELCNIAPGGKIKAVAYGEDSPNAKLTQVQVDDMRSRFMNGENRTSLSKTFNVSISNVCDIINYSVWNHNVDITQELLDRTEARIKEDHIKQYESLPEPWNKGLEMTEKYCRNVSIGLTGLVPSAEIRAKRSKAMKGRMPKNINLIHSPEVAKKRGLLLRGEGNGCALLNEAKVIKLRELHKTHQYKIKELAEMFGIKECTVYDVVGRRSWKHI